MLGTLRSGGTYLPLDAKWPSERRRFMMEDAECEQLVAQTVHLIHFAWFCGAVLPLDDASRRALICLLAALTAAAQVLLESALFGLAALLPGSRVKMPSTVPDDSAPFAPLASLEAQPRPQQPQAAPHDPESRRSLVESGGKVGSK